VVEFMGIFGERLNNTEFFLIQLLSKKDAKLSYPQAIEVISTKMQVRPSTALIYFNLILQRSKKIKHDNEYIYLEAKR
jgi:hypothetical protein